MLKGEDIQQLVRLLQDRRVSLYHACQLVDFQSYLNVGGIPSRKHLESVGQSYTRFDTDERDHTNNVWDKVFANLSDFGSTFANGNKGVPNPFGPILFQIKPEALSQAEDVAICLCSAGKSGFNRNQESLRSVEDVNRLFSHKIEASKSYYLKNRKELSQEFNKTNASFPEINCSIESGKISLYYVESLKIEPYYIQGQSLKSKVEDIIFKTGQNFNFTIDNRYRVPPYTQELIDLLLLNRILSLEDLSRHPNAVSPQLKDWASGVMSNNIEYQFNRFVKYLRTGTLLPLLEGQL